MLLWNMKSVESFLYPPNELQLWGFSLHNCTCWIWGLRGATKTSSIFFSSLPLPLEVNSTNKLFLRETTTNRNASESGGWFVGNSPTSTTMMDRTLATETDKKKKNKRGFEVQFSGRRNWFWIIKQLLQFSWCKETTMLTGGGRRWRWKITLDVILLRVELEK